MPKKKIKKNIYIILALKNHDGIFEAFVFLLPRCARALQSHKNACFGVRMPFQPQLDKKTTKSSTD
jgi:hypothetical protein